MMLLDPGNKPAHQAAETGGFALHWSAPEHALPLILTGVACVIWLAAFRFRKVWAALVGINSAVVAAYTVWSARNGHWLPEKANELANDVDGLFNQVMFLITVFFIITQCVLVYTMLQKAPEGGRAKPVHGNHILELVWTLIPGALLVYIAIAQLPTWAKMKGQNAGALLPSGYEAASDPADLLVTVTGKQWEWRMRYADPTGARPENPLQWASTPAVDDVHVVNQLHAWQGAKVRLLLRTTDVIHSFFLPQFRFKQDMLPGKTIPALLYADKTNLNPDGTERSWEIACAELCGGNHYRMRGRVLIHPDRESFMAWLKDQKSGQSARKDPLAAANKIPATSTAGKQE